LAVASLSSKHHWQNRGQYGPAAEHQSKSATRVFPTQGAQTIHTPLLSTTPLSSSSSSSSSSCCC
ncbi:hypothetical protein INR49_015963, partial [Caranx melampygus]